MDVRNHLLFTPHSVFFSLCWYKPRAVQLECFLRLKSQVHHSVDWAFAFIQLLILSKVLPPVIAPEKQCFVTVMQSHPIGGSVCSKSMLKCVLPGICPELPPDSDLSGNPRWDLKSRLSIFQLIYVILLFLHICKERQHNKCGLWSPFRVFVSTAFSQATGIWRWILLFLSHFP